MFTSDATANAATAEREKDEKGAGKVREPSSKAKASLEEGMVI